MANATSSLLRSALDLELSELSFTADRLVVRSAPGLIRRALAAVVSLPLLIMTLTTLQHFDPVMLGLLLLLGAVTLPFVLLVGVSVHEKSYSRAEGLKNSLRVFGWVTEARSSVPPGATVIVRDTTSRGQRRFAVSLSRCDGMELSVWNDEALAVEVAGKLAALLGLPMERAAPSLAAAR
ncbi:MAG: hypothetical protein Q8L14_23405 [Myxococcales bacterium]|nr:hypothetical protein [Myxococcales bacterium]